MTRYRLSREAERDLQSIKQYLLVQGSPAIARYVLHRLRTALRFLAANPGAGHSRADLTTEPVKFWSVFSYLIVYDPATTPIGIARILHGAQDLEAIFEKEAPRP